MEDVNTTDRHKLYYQKNKEKINAYNKNYYNYIYFTENNLDETSNLDEEFTFEMFLNKDFVCSICFDTANEQNTNENETVTLECKHKFHKTCLKTHVEINNKICPMCRKDIENEIKEEEKIENEWIINPLTKRRVKIGSRTYKYLKENNENYYEYNKIYDNVIKIISDKYLDILENLKNKITINNEKKKVERGLKEQANLLKSFSV